MNREIKFRHYTDKKFIYSDQEGWEYWGDCVMAYENEVQQYTGLKDKNNKEIYEGDILKIIVPDYSDKGFREELDIVEYSNMAINEEDNQVCMGFYINRDYNGNTEVVGNIYENPELLNGINS